MPAQWRDKRTVTLALLVAAGLINFLDRSSLSIAASSIRASMHLSARDLGSLLSAFAFAYGIAQLPLGPLLDRMGAWRVMQGSLVVWSLSQMITGAAPGPRSFLALRVLLGLGEAPFFPASVKLVREQFSEEQRGRAISAVNISTAVGQAIAPILLTGLMLWLGWRAMFAFLGGLGLALAVIWMMAGKSFSREQTNTARAQSVSLSTWVSLFQRRSTWGMMLGFGGVNYTAWFYISWLPTYLQSERHLSIASSGWLTALPFLAGSVGMYTSGALADWRSRRESSLQLVHFSQILFGMIASAGFTLIATQVRSLPAALGCIMAALFCIHFAGTSAWGYVQALSEPSAVASIASIQNFGSFMIASTGPLLTGWLLDRTHAFKSAFVLCGVLTLGGAASYLCLARPKRSIAILETGI